MNTTVIHTTYVNKTIVTNTTIVNNTHSSFNGGPNGVAAETDAAEQQAFASQPHDSCELRPNSNMNKLRNRINPILLQQIMVCPPMPRWRVRRPA